MICPHCQHDIPKNALACPHCGRSPSQTAPSLLATGQILAGRYEIQRELGRGGMGVVFKAHDRALDEIVAIKVLLTYAAPSDDLTRRFRSEIKLARRVMHPNVCRIFEYGEIGDLRFITMEFIDGEDLRSIVRRDGPFTPEQACDIGLEVASALEAIHALHIIHRDLKTVNLMRDASGVVRLMDFGIAKAHQQEGGTDVTATGMIIGTPEYMSPEQARGVKVSAQSDIYSFGVVMHELVTGEVPFKGDTPLATILKHIQQPPNIDPARVPAPIRDLLKKTLAKNPAERYKSARELSDAIHDVKTALSDGYPALTVADPTPTIGLTRTTLRPATGAAAVPLPTQRARDVRWLSWGGVVLAWLVFGAAVLALGVFAYMRHRQVAPRVSPDDTPAAQSTAVVAMTPSGGFAAPAVQAQATPEMARTIPMPSVAARRPPASGAMAGASPSPGGEISADVLARLDQLALQSPDIAYEQARRMSHERASSGTLAARVERYRALYISRLVDDGGQALKRASLARSRESYADALRLFEKALEIDPAQREARQGRLEALKGMEEPRAASDIVTFVMSEMSFTPPPTMSNPPGFEAPQSGAQIRSAQAPSPRLQLAIEVAPAQVRVGDVYTVRYYAFNRSASQVRIGAVTIRNSLGRSSVTGGAVDPLVRSIIPKTRALLLETSATWQNDPAAYWTTTLTIVLDDGGSYAVSLRSIR